MRDLNTQTAPALQPAPRRVGAGVAAPQHAAVAGTGRDDARRRTTPAHDPDCYLCPRSSRAGGLVNPDYRSTFVFDNDFPALLPSTAPADQAVGDLLVARTETRHVPRRLFLAAARPHAGADGSPRAPRRRRRVGRRDARRSARRPAINYVQIFENRGAAMGASNPHPHGQIWATATVPNEPAREQEALRAHRAVARHLPSVRLSRGGAVARGARWSARTRRSSRWSRSGPSGRSKRWSCRRRHVGGLDDLTSPSATRSPTSSSA